MTQTWLPSSQFPTHANKGGCHSFMFYSVGLKAGPRSKQSTNSHKLTNEKETEIQQKDLPTEAKMWEKRR